jgi:GcrA cell cycle regulator
MRGVAWTRRRLDLLKTLWAEGRTATDIARQLRISRAAVLGKVFRLRLKPQKAAPMSAPMPARSDAGSPSPDPRRRGRRYPDERVAPRGKSLLELTNGTCRWPVGKPGTAGFHFCGEAGADLENGRPYCERHAKRAYVKSAKSADRVSRASVSKSVGAIQSPPIVPDERRQRIIVNVPRRRA